MATLVDTNVLLDVATNDAHWAQWSMDALDAAVADGPVVINAVIYAEFSIGYARIEDVDRVLGASDLRLVDLPRQALFLAGKALQRYRKAKGTRTGFLPDFFIGAHAAVTGMTLVTRDPRRYRRYFPTVDLIAPERT